MNPDTPATIEPTPAPRKRRHRRAPAPAVGPTPAETASLVNAYVGADLEDFARALDDAALCALVLALEQVYTERKAAVAARWGFSA